ncbi:MAG: M28 family peptidase [Planctomycetota bacterium]|nr:M28 family peptidase [Planctomycetota bacterium]
MSRSKYLFVFCFVCVFSSASLVSGRSPQDQPADITERDAAAAAKLESRLIRNTRQLTFEGKRAGEGYFSADGKQIVFQSERDPANPFYQIYLMDLENGDQEKISPGQGKTTCAWIHPEGDRVLFSSTHADPEALEKQKQELDFRASGKERRYAWDYDPFFDLWEFNRKTKAYRRLTSARGYCAEGSWSPDGKLIAFASNRRAFEGQMSEKEKKNFEIDPAYMNDIYVMNADGSNVRQLTDVPGYDGGPFFSADGKKICWRRFSENGATAEIMSMNVDGSNQRQLTRLNHMSWAPYFHPSGKYLIFTTNKHGFGNFELYLVAAEGPSQPVRVTYTRGFDGLPVFLPGGKKISWTSNRTSGKKSQIFIADWDHEAALKSLGLDAIARVDPETESADRQGSMAAKLTSSDFRPADLLRHVDYLCRRELGGRLTGTRGEKLATAYVASYFDSLGLEPAGKKGSWYQEFSFPAGARLGRNNRLSLGDSPIQLDEDWRPLTFSGNGEFPSAPVVFGGYGIVAPKTENQEEYDSYVHLDVKDKWVMVFRFLPENISPERRQFLSPYSGIRRKAMVARDKGARGLIVVSGPNSKVRSQLVPLREDSKLSGTSIAVVSVTDRMGEKLLSNTKRRLQSLQDKLDAGGLMIGFDLKQKLQARIEVEQVRKTGRNVLGRLVVGDKPSDDALIVCAHIDHLGMGPSSGSLARNEERMGVHVGADDNASGVAAMMEIAEYLANQKKQGKLDGNRDVIFAGWSGEELGLHGSKAYVKMRRDGYMEEMMKAHAGITGNAGKSGDGKPSPEVGPVKMDLKNIPIYGMISGCFNMDMVGRFDKKLILQGIASSSDWRSAIERRNAPIGLPLSLVEDTNLPTDATSFYEAGVPILSAFTGSHSDYHTPRDTPEKLDYDKAAQIARLIGLLVREFSLSAAPPTFTRAEQKAQDRPRAGLRAYLGTIPDYGEDVTGVLISGATKGAPAEKAGLKAGDVIVELAGKKIENIYDYTYAIEALKIGKKTTIVIEREGKRIKFELTPSSRE